MQASQLHFRNARTHRCAINYSHPLGEWQKYRSHLDAEGVETMSIVLGVATAGGGTEQCRFDVSDIEIDMDGEWATFVIHLKGKLYWGIVDFIDNTYSNIHFTQPPQFVDDQVA